MDISYRFMMLGCLIFTLRFLRWQYSLTCWNGCLPVKVETAFATLLSFQRTPVMFEDTSVTTSDDLHFSLFIFTISCNGAFSIRFLSPFLLQQLPLNSNASAKLDLQNSCPWKCDNWGSAPREVCWIRFQLLMHQDLILCFHTPAELNHYQRMSKIGYNTLMDLP